MVLGNVKTPLPRIRRNSLVKGRRAGREGLEPPSSIYGTVMKQMQMMVGGQKQVAVLKNLAAVHLQKPLEKRLYKTAAVVGRWIE